MNPLISIIIPTYNRGYCIEECIRSAQSQSYLNIEIIVVDDASRDDTRNRIARIADPRLRYFAHEHNRGGAAARNTGICCAEGEYIAFLDSDDRWLPDKLEKQLRGLEQKGDRYGISYTWLQCIDAQGRETMRVNPEYEGDCRQEILVSNFIGSFSNVLVRRNMLMLVGCLDESMRSCQDWDILIRLLRLTHVHCERDYLVQYRQDVNDSVRISLNPRSVVQGHRRIRRKFAAEYRALPRTRRLEALRAYFNVFAGIGAFGEAARTFGAMLLEHASPFEIPRLMRGLMRAAKNAATRKWRRRQSPRLRIGSAAQ